MSRPATRRAPAPLTTHALSLPDDLWLEVLARLPPADLPAALASCSELRRLAPFAWRGLCLHRWPAWSAISTGAGLPIRDWKRQAEFFELRDREEEAVRATAGAAGPPPPIAPAGVRPTVEGAPAPAAPIGPRHRAILVEWLAEVAFEWGTESTVVFKAAAYLDAYLATQTVEDLSQFQLLGIASLRAAMADAAARAAAAAVAATTAAASAQPARGPTPAASDASDGATTSGGDTAASVAPTATRGRGGRRAPPAARAAPSGLQEEGEAGGAAKPTTSTAAGPAADAAPATPDDPLDPARFAHVAARTYTPSAVADATAAVVAASPPALAAAPNAKMFLRAFWYRALAAGGVKGGGEAMHVYTLASFFLSLALLDASWAATPASLAAGGALALALEVTGEAAGVDERTGAPVLWPAALQAASGHTPGAVAAQAAALKALQASTPAPHLRRVWAAHHAGHGYAEFSAQWDAVLGVMAEAGEV